MTDEEKKYPVDIIDAKGFVIDSYTTEVEREWFSFGPCIGGAYSKPRARLVRTANGEFGKDNEFRETTNSLIERIDTRHREFVVALDRPHDAGCPCP